MNPSGKAIWQLLDGRTSLAQLTRQLASDYAAPVAVVEEDVRGFVRELLQRQMLEQVAD